MDNKQFTFRRRIESDFEILYKAYEEYAWSNIQPYFSGPCVVLDKAEFLEQFQKIPQDHRRPSVIVNADDTPCGVYRTTYQHANRYSEISIYMWRDTHLAKAVLKEVIDQTLGIGIPNHRVLAEIPGYAPELKRAADDLGMELVGMLPDYLQHNEELHHKYYYVIASERWFSGKDSQAGTGPA